MRIAYSTPAQFPDASAGTNRMISLGQALVAGGAEVTFIGGHVQSCDSPDRVGPGPVVGVADLPRDRVRAVRGVRHLVTGGNLARWLRDQGSEKFDAVITYGGGGLICESLEPLVKVNWNACNCRLRRVVSA